MQPIFPEDTKDSANTLNNKSVNVSSRAATHNPNRFVKGTAYTVGGVATAGIAGIFGVSVTAAVGASVSGAIAAKIGLTVLVAGLAANPIGAIAIAGAAGLALIGIFGFAAYKGYQAYKAYKTHQAKGRIISFFQSSAPPNHEGEQVYNDSSPTSLMT